MYADPASIKFDGTNTDTLPRTGVGAGVGTFTDSTGLKKAFVRQTQTKTRLRHEARVTMDKLSADPLNPSTNIPKSASVYIVIDTPIVGFNATELTGLYDGVRLWTSANIAKLVGGEF